MTNLVKCSICFISKPTSDYFRNKNTKNGHQNHCKKCHKVMTDSWEVRNKEKSRERKRKAGSIFRKKYPEKCRETNRDCYAKYGKKYREKERIRERLRRIRVFDYYGGKCACCGESNYHFLSIDHKKSDGYMQRKNRSGSINLEVIKSNFSEDYQILCFNCNFSREFYGGKEKICPHKANKNFLDSTCFRIGNQKQKGAD